eukprot:6203132-Pleurochrysis_carterae.AAC.1
MTELTRARSYQPLAPMSARFGERPPWRRLVSIVILNGTGKTLEPAAQVDVTGSTDGALPRAGGASPSRLRLRASSLLAEAAERAP